MLFFPLQEKPRTYCRKYFIQMKVKCVTLVKQEERMGEGARGMTNICWVPIVWQA